MFGFEFLFLGSLLALPLVGLPLVLHLMFRRKTPVVLFSTTRFVQASLQRTAARRKVQRWLLLAARMLLLLLLILAAAQPARRMLAGGAGDYSGIAAIVVDTSYSMQLAPGGQSRLQEADQAIRQLLTDEFAGAQVAIFTSQPSSAHQGLRPSSEVLTNWQPLQPQANVLPLVDRVAAATSMLDAQPSREKHLVILSDFQEHDFPRAAAQWPTGRVLVIDLHPETARSAGVTALAIEPEQAIPGVAIEAAARLEGRSGDSRAVTVQALALDGRPLNSTAPRVVQFDASGSADIRLPLRPPAEPFMVLQACLDGQDELIWDDQRALALASPAPRRVKVVSTTDTAAARVMALALDPSEGRQRDWPLRVSRGELAGQDQVVVAIWETWPAPPAAAALHRFVEQGGTLILALRPGLQEAWATLPDPQKTALRPLLPGEPILDPAADRPHRAAPPAAAVGWMRELLDPRFQLGAMTTQRLVPLQPSAQSQALLMAAPVGDGSPLGLIYRHTAGAGAIHTLTSLPDPQFSTLATHPIFLPMLVRMSLPEGSAASAQNGHLGDVLSLTLPEETQLNVITPSGATFAVSRAAGNPSFTFAKTGEVGIYRWQRSADQQVVGIASIQPPAEESRLRYREAAGVLPGEQVVIARSLDELRGTLTEAARPSPRWAPLIALVLLLLCAEAVLGNSSSLWKLFSPAARSADKPAAVA